MEIDRGRRDPSFWTGGQAVTIYLIAGIVYIILGVFIPELLFSWWEGVPFLVLFVWAVNALRKRL